MPQFLANGPDIPDSLLEAQEEGRVVFFCGAGISYPAGLPGFKGLVDKIYKRLDTSPNDIEQQVYDREQYDATLDLLEHRYQSYQGQRLEVRTALASELKPNWRRKDATTTHEALLQLATDRNDRVRLVTTNFDRIFARVTARQKPAIPCYAAPLLPIPKPSRWHGVVHLHGLLPALNDETALNRLVLTSGDFGLAYLTERWAARFVTELFRNYVVCFVGYSIGDPVLRYMLDALAVDEMLGESRHKAYAFGSFTNGKRERAMLEWKSKHVTPLLYEVPANSKDHSALHLTLKEWAETSRDGVRGKEMIVAKHATTPPVTASRADFVVGRMLWALTDEFAAKHFADLDPAPPLAWLEALAAAQFRQEDLPRFGVAPRKEKDDELTFSLVQRPTPYALAPRMHLSHLGSSDGNWDPVMRHLGRWLTRHLDDPDLVLWLAKQGGHLHEELAELVQDRLDYLGELANEDNQDELTRIRAAAPNAIPSQFMRVLWRMLLTGRVRNKTKNFELHDWKKHLMQDGLTPSLRMGLREKLTPRVTFTKPSRWDETVPIQREPQSARDLVSWEIILSADHAHLFLNDLAADSEWRKGLPDFLYDATSLLRDALDLMRELGGADDSSDRSYTSQPSISEHPQNHRFRDWTALIDLNRDAWQATLLSNPMHARHVAECWQHTPYPLFKRLAFFAAAQEDAIPPRQCLDWLLADENRWLWSRETQREAIRLMLAVAPRLAADDMRELENALLKGPQQETRPENIAPEIWTSIVENKCWLRLAKLRNASVTLGPTAEASLNELSQKYPTWKLAEDLSDEFPFWLGNGLLPVRFEATPRRRRALINWLKAQHDTETDWPERCRHNFPTTAYALFALSREGDWLIGRPWWGEALQTWTEDALLKTSWLYMAGIVACAPDAWLLANSNSVGWWFRAQAKTFSGQTDFFLRLARRLLDLKREDTAAGIDDILVDHVTEALLRWWYRQDPKDSEGLPRDIKELFTAICDTHVEQYRRGRETLAKHTIALFRVDEEWSRTHLLPLFDWQTSEAEACVAWDGFLRSPRPHEPLLTAIKQPLLATATHFMELGESASQYAGFLTVVALDASQTFTTDELADATNALPAEGLQSAAEILVRTLDGAGERRVEYWRNRVLPYFAKIWPKSRELATQEISETFAQLCVAAGDAFPEALAKLQHWLQPIKHPDYLLHLLAEAKLCRQYPADALNFLNAAIGEEARWVRRELQTCLDDIKSANPALANDKRFVRLTNHVQRSGRS